MQISEGFDWLEITGSRGLRDVEAFPYFGTFQGPFSSRLYRRVMQSPVCRVMTDPRWSHLAPWRVELPGSFWKSDVSRMLPVLEWFDYSTITRIDWRRDYILDQAEHLAETRKGPYKLITSRGKPLRVTNFSIDGTFSGFKAGTADLVYRWYDKAREQNRSDIFWWRWEVAIRGDFLRRLQKSAAWKPSTPTSIGPTVLDGAQHRFQDCYELPPTFQPTTRPERFPPTRDRDTFNPQTFIEHHLNRCASTIRQRLALTAGLEHDKGDSYEPPCDPSPDQRPHFSTDG